MTVNENLNDDFKNKGRDQADDRKGSNKDKGDRGRHDAARGGRNIAEKASNKVHEGIAKIKEKTR